MRRRSLPRMTIGLYSFGLLLVAGCDEGQPAPTESVSQASEDAPGVPAANAEAALRDMRFQLIAMDSKQSPVPWYIFELQAGAG